MKLHKKFFVIWFISALFVVWPSHFIQAEDCYAVTVLKGGKVVSSTGSVSVPKNSTGYQLQVQVTSTAQNNACRDSYFKFGVRHINKDDSKTDIVPITSAQVISSTGYNLKVALPTDGEEGIYEYILETYKDYVGSDISKPNGAVSNYYVRVILGSAGKADTGSNTPTTTRDPNPVPTVDPAKSADEINTDVSYKNSTNFDGSLGELFNPIQYNTVPEIVVRAIQILLAIVAGLAVIVIVIAGFRMVVSNGNEGQVTKAKQALTWAIAGLVLSLLSFSIVAIIQRII